MYEQALRYTLADTPVGGQESYQVPSSQTATPMAGCPRNKGMAVCIYGRAAECPREYTSESV